jgi:hypothetical protein
MSDNRSLSGAVPAASAISLFLQAAALGTVVVVGLLPRDLSPPPEPCCCVGPCHVFALGLGEQPVGQDRRLAHVVIAWNDLIEAERIEQLSLVPVEAPIIASPPLPRLLPAVNHGSRLRATDFCKKICQL